MVGKEATAMATASGLTVLAVLTMCELRNFTDFNQVLTVVATYHSVASSDLKC